MTQNHDAKMSRDGLVEILKQHGFVSKPYGTVEVLKRDERQDGDYIVCFMYPEESENPKKNSGFAGIGRANKNHEYDGTNFEIRYGITTYEEFRRNMQKKCKSKID